MWSKLPNQTTRLCRWGGMISIMSTILSNSPPTIKQSNFLLPSWPPPEIQLQLIIIFIFQLLSEIIHINNQQSIRSSHLLIQMPKRAFFPCSLVLCGGWSSFCPCLRTSSLPQSQRNPARLPKLLVLLLWNSHILDSALSSFLAGFW